ncbi:MAG: hypothetical protein WC584_01665 [Candidatus Pacearchaeota archaeon]
MNVDIRVVTGIIIIIFGFGLMSIPLFSGKGGFVAWVWNIQKF